MKLLILISLISISAIAHQSQPNCIGKSIFGAPPIPKGVKLQIANNKLTLNFRYTNNKTCTQVMTFDESGIITNYAEKGICGSKLQIVTF